MEQENPLDGDQGAQRFRTLARKDDIPHGRGRAFPVDDRIIAIFRLGEEFFAIDDICPHMGASLAEGELDGDVVTCPWHAWRFCIRDGTWCDNRRVKTGNYPVRVQGDEVQVLLPDASAPAQ